MLNPDFRDMLSAFVDEDVEFLLVGAYALAAHGIVRATGDLDLWIRRSPTNAERTLRALHSFGAPVADLTSDDLLDPDVILQIGIQPHRIDILTAIDGVDFEEAWSERDAHEVEALQIPLLSAQHLIRNKRATGRDKDRLDAENLERLLNRGQATN